MFLNRAVNIDRMLWYLITICTDDCVWSRSRDRSILVRGAWGETHRALREEAQQRGCSGQRGDATCRQDAGAAPQQPKKQREPGESAGWRRQGLVTMTVCPLPVTHKPWVSWFCMLMKVIYSFAQAPDCTYFSLVSVLRHWLTWPLMK